MGKSKKHIDYYIAYEIDEDGYFIASWKTIIPFGAQGKTIDEAYKNIRDAIDSCLEALRVVDKELPEERFSPEAIQNLSFVREEISQWWAKG